MLCLSQSVKQTEQNNSTVKPLKWKALWHWHQLKVTTNNTQAHNRLLSTLFTRHFVIMHVVLFCFTLPLLSQLWNCQFVLSEQLMTSAWQTLTAEEQAAILPVQKAIYNGSSINYIVRAGNNQLHQVTCTLSNFSHYAVHPSIHPPWIISTQLYD